MATLTIINDLLSSLPGTEEGFQDPSPVPISSHPFSVGNHSHSESVTLLNRNANKISYFNLTRESRPVYQVSRNKGNIKQRRIVDLDASNGIKKTKVLEWLTDSNRRLCP
uniref:Uncharacterized protein n=1 Tax=Nelumbo nucifera TaxID=4432 RepID=A0A822YFJ7_NELNU|nr:TPA_asm: hypothetical protein HUJ06_009794 [Nelumbo nucifera]